MNFHDTKMGRVFFEHQLPQLIHSIQALTDALGKSAQPLTLPVAGDPAFLSALYYGSYEPGPFQQTPEGKKLTQAVNAAYEELEPLLSDKGREKLVKYQDALTVRETADMQLAYESGFRTAVQMIVSGLSRPAATPADNTV